MWLRLYIFLIVVKFYFLFSILSNPFSNILPNQNKNTLTHLVIDLWSKGITIKRHYNDIAKDLLKGAFDLQESLVMLGKLQQASQHMAKLKKKKK